jgi:hypothetical protein
MNRKLDVRDLETVDRLVQAEIEEGLAAFRAGGAEPRLRALVAAGPWPARRRRPHAKASVPILLAAAAAAVAVIVVTSPPAPRPIDARDLMAVLLRSPSLAQFRARAFPEPVTHDANGGFERVLSAGRSGGGTVGASGTGEGPDKVPSLSPSDRMRILYKDKVIERALTLLISKSKEA